MSDDLEEWAKEEQESATVDIPALRKLLMRSSGISLEDIADKFGCTKGTALDACEQLKASGANIHELGGKYTIEKHPAPKPESEIHRLQSDKNGVYRFGLISDTHYGSKYAREDLCERLYDWFGAEGIKSVYHCGNWVDGEASFNKFDLIPEAHGMQAQLDYFVARYPARKGITTFYVAGDDHEGWWVQREGIEIGEALENTAHRAGRNDLVYLGYKEAFITLTHKVSGARARMLVDHPGGGTAYATSYSAQKRVEGLQGGEKPAVWCFGHWHKAGYFRPRNVHVILVPCTKDLDPWGRKKGLEYHLGGIVVELHQDAETGAIVRCLPNFELCFDRGYYNQQYSPHGRIEKREAPE